MLLTSGFCEGIRLIFGENFSRWLAGIIYQVFFNGIIMPLARLGTRYEYLCLADLDQDSAPIRALREPGPNVVRKLVSDRRPSKEATTQLDCYIRDMPKVFTEKLSFLDVRQGVGYDLTQDERAIMSPLFVYGPRERSPLQVRMTSRILTWLASYRKGDVLQVLDIGAGNCSASERLATIIPMQCEFVCCDINPNIMRLGIRRLAARPDLKAHLLLCDGMELPFKDNSFDLVVNFGSINQMPSPAKAMAEMLRVCLPGGLSLLRDERGVDPTRVSVLEREWLRRFDKEKLPFDGIPTAVHDLQIDFLDSINFSISYIKR